MDNGGGKGAGVLPVVRPTLGGLRIAHPVRTDTEASVFPLRIAKPFGLGCKFSKKCLMGRPPPLKNVNGAEKVRCPRKFSLFVGQILGNIFEKDYLCARYSKKQQVWSFNI